MKNRTELNLVFFPESLLSRRQCFQEWSHTVSSFVLPVLPPRSQKSICGFLERMLYFWEWCPEQASFRVILQSYRGAIKSSFAAIFYVQSSVLGLTAAISIYSYLWIKKKKKEDFSYNGSVRFSPSSPSPPHPLFTLKGTAQALK